MEADEGVGDCSSPHKSGPQFKVGSAILQPGAWWAHTHDSVVRVDGVLQEQGDACKPLPFDPFWVCGEYPILFDGWDDVVMGGVSTCRFCVTRPAFGWQLLMGGAAVAA